MERATVVLVTARATPWLRDEHYGLVFLTLRVAPQRDLFVDEGHSIFKTHLTSPQK
jgi:hypothetical protein